jgi:8-oxo-dGTP diphosphatase
MPRGAGTEVVPGGRLGTDLPIDAGVLRVRTARLAVDAPEPQALEHAALRWVAAAAIPAVDWVDADRAVVPELLDLLGAGAPTPPRA